MAEDAVVRILHLEDDSDDAQLIATALRVEGTAWEIVQVDNREEFARALDSGGFDVILSDYSLPGFNGLAALTLARKRFPDIPFILVSGTIGEELAIDAVSVGATDFVLKDRLGRLAPAVRRALDETRASRARRAAEKALLESEKRYRSLVENALDGIFQESRAGRFTAVNPAMARILGYESAEELISEVTQVGELYVDPGRRAELVGALETEGQVSGFEVQLRRRDGELIWSRLAMRAVRDAQGVLVGFEGLLDDITQDKAAEEHLRQMQRVDAIGRLAGGVAHDFNNILGVITGYAELAIRQVGPEHPARPRLDQIMKAATRAAGLTRQLLAFSRKQVMQPKVVDLNGLVGETEKMLGRLIGEHIKVVLRPASRLGAVKVDPGQIEQVILNLAVNARDAMPKGGMLTLETANIDFDEEYAGVHPPAKAGRHVMLAVSDTGIGMDLATQRRIFEPFFTTKPEGQGTGLGLATVYGIVKQSGGFIWVYSEPGLGTTFKVYLPRVDEPIEAAPTVCLPAETPRGHETILVVEDTETLREVIRETLEERGYTLLLASEGEKASALARSHKGPIHLLLTDVVMPKLGGGDLAKILIAMRPEIRVLYMSGYTEGAISHHGVLEEGLVLLEKPFTGDRLARAVREALDRPIPQR